MYHKRNKDMGVVALYLGNYKKSYFLRQISRLTNIPLKTCQSTLAYLEKEKILKSRTEGKNKYFSLNLENINTKSYLLKAEIYKTEIFIEYYPEIKMFLKALKTNTTILVFGSFANLKAKKESDLDLLILGEEKQPFHLLPFKLHKINLKEQSFVKEIEEKHIILNNHSFYVNVMWDYYA